MRPAGLRALSLVPSGPIDVLNSSLPRNTWSANASAGSAVEAIARDLLVLRRIVARDVDHRHVARDQVHHVGTRVVAVDHHALGARVARFAGVDAHFDAHDVAGVARGRWRVDRRLAVGVEHQADQPIGGARQHETFERAGVLERHCGRVGREQLLARAPRTGCRLFMLKVSSATSWSASMSITDTNDCTLTLNLTGPLGDDAVFGT